MALSLDYVVRETASNLRRNLLMTTAAVLTVAVSLSLAGSALLLKQGVSRATIQWRGGVELSIFLNPDVNPTQSYAIERELKGMPAVKKATYVDQDAAFEEFKAMFGNRPEMVESVTAKDLPPSFRVIPDDADNAESIGGRFKDRAGIKDVVYAKDTVETLLTITRYAQIIIYAIALVLLLSAALLILNTIRMAIFARRREVAVMKLVGATNWFIRVPFMLEGMMQGLAGAGIAFIVVSVGRKVIERLIHDAPLLTDFLVPGGDVLGTGLFILAVGALVGAVGSAIAVTRFLDV